MFRSLDTDDDATLSINCLGMMSRKYRREEANCGIIGELCLCQSTGSCSDLSELYTVMGGRAVPQYRNRAESRDDYTS